MSYRSSSPPISGFAGHVPGKKWQVGGRNSNLNDFRRENSNQSSNSAGMMMPNGASLTPEQFAQLYQQQMAQMQANGQIPGYGMVPFGYSFNPYVMNGGMMPNMGGINPSASIQGLNQLGAATEQNGPTRPDSGQKSRSKSLPRKQPKSDVKDIFGGIESGWWSEGQALKNLRRHQQGMTDSNASNSNFGDSHNERNLDVSSTSIRTARRPPEFDDDFDVPTAGYSGHVPGIKQHGIGKSFTVAAKEARRVRHNANDSTMISSSSANSAAQKAKNNPPASPQTFPRPQQTFSTPQNPFMQSYPYGMMPYPMFMPMQPPQNPAPSEYSHILDRT